MKYWKNIKRIYNIFIIQGYRPRHEKAHCGFQTGAESARSNDVFAHISPRRPAILPDAIIGITRVIRTSDAENWYVKYPSIHLNGSPSVTQIT